MAQQPAQNIFVQLQNVDGTLTGSPLSIPVETTPKQLEVLVNEFLSNEESLPYSFFAGDVEIISSIKSDVLSTGRISDEGIVTIVFRPQAVFRVNAVSRCTSSLAGHEECILSLSFSPDGRRLASGAGDNTVRFWDLSTETPLVTGRGHTGWVLCVSWSPDGHMLASGGMDGIICLWEAQSGALKGKLCGHRQWITSLAWEPAHLCYPTQRLVSSSKDGTAKIWNVVQRTCSATLSQHTDAVTCVRWGGDGTIYSASRDRSIKMWYPDGRLKGQLAGHAHWINSLALSSDFVLRTGPFRPNDRTIAASDAENQKIALERYTEAIKIAGGERLISGSDDFTMFLWEPKPGATKPLARLTGHQALVNHVAFSPDGRYISSAGFDKSIKIWDGNSGKFLASLRGHVGRVYQAVWSADSRLLMSCSQDSTLKVWDVRTRTLKQDLPGHFDEVYAVDWSPAGDRGASGGKDKLLKLWRQ